MSKLSNIIELGVFELNVRDLNLLKDFYHLLVGLEIINEDSTTVTLGFNGSEIIRLNSNPILRLSKRHETGLYHSAILFSGRNLLANTIKRILINYPSSYFGSADHLVSEAFYFNDPEGNGLELYFDKDKNDWIWKDGLVQMDSLYLNVKEYIETYSGPQIESEIKRTGHIHLKVGSLKEAEKFYTDIIGFTKVSEFPGAIFISDGKYHHHIGINIWESQGSTSKEETLGLKSFEILLGNKKDLENLKERLQINHINFKYEEDVLTVSDPWGNFIKFTIYR